MQLTSTAFDHEGLIPPQYTCDGDEIVPPLSFSEVPEETQALVLIMDDPDVPKELRADGMWDHWVKFNIAPTVRGIAEGEEPEGVCGRGTSGNLSYHGPCPPDREHRYFFKLYALDTELSLEEGASKSELERAMEGHIIEEAVLMGRYERNQ